MSRALAEHSIKRNNALARQHALRPVVHITGRLEHTALSGPPSVLFFIFVLAKDVQSFEARGVVRARAATGVCQCGAQLSMVQVLRAADREHAHAVVGIVNNIVAQLGRDG